MAVAEKRRYRTDLDGLRGVAILGVVVYHLWIGRVSGGVDIFLFLSGYFFVDSQIRGAVYRTGPTIVQSIVRTLRRLLPALFTVIAAVLVISVFTLPTTTLLTKLPEFSASAFFYENFYLMEHGATYAAASESVSPLQNMWSMAIQGQFYLLVILAVPAIVWALRKSKLDEKRQIAALAAILLLMSIASMIVANSSDDQIKNYYSSTSRAWELCLGGLVAILMGYVPLLKGKLAAAVSVALGAIGLLGMALTGVITNGTDEFPGWHALLPVGSALLIVLAGAISDVKWSVNGLFSTRPFLIVGETAYAWYLWHWPLFIILMTVYHQDWWLAPVVFTGSFVLARATYVWIERPLRQSEKQGRYTAGMTSYVKNSWRRRRKQNPVVWRPVLVILLGALIVAASPLGHRYEQIQASRAADAAKNVGDYPGALAFAGANVPSGKPLIPDLLDPDAMNPMTTADGCIATWGETDIKRTGDGGKNCVYGDVNSPYSIAVIGGSHSEHWMPALDDIGKRDGIKIVPYLKFGCPVQIGAVEERWDGQPFDDCRVWSDAVVAEITGPNRPTAVFATSTRPQTINGDGPDKVPDGYAALWKGLADAGVPMIGVRDNPWLLTADGEQSNARDCLAAGNNGNVCGIARSKALSPVDPAIAVAAQYRTMRLIDMTDYLCTATLCPAVAGNVLVYRDAHHYTKQYVMTMVKPMEERLTAAFQELTPWRPKPPVSTTASPAR